MGAAWDLAERALLMSRSLAYSILFSFAAMAVALIAARPEWVADQNSFLKNFVNHEFIAVLGVTLAITLASAAQIHLEFNRIEEAHRVRNRLEKSRRNLRTNAYWLIGFFVAGIAVVTIKPIAASSPSGEAFFNLLALFLLLWSVLILTSIIDLVFAIEPEFFDDEPIDDQEAPTRLDGGSEPRSPPGT